MMKAIMTILDRVVLRAVTCGAWLMLVSYQLLERSDPVMSPRGETTLSLVASWTSAATGVVWLVVAALIVVRRGIGAKTWTMTEHRIALACSVTFLLASLMAQSPIYSIMSVALGITSLMDMIDARRARDLVDEHGLEDAAVEFEKEAGSRKEATRKALELLSVRDEVGNDLAYEVLCSIPMPKDEAHEPA